MEAHPEVLAYLTSVLEEMGVAYMIGGSVAYGVWASPRQTHDLDVVIDLPLERIPEFCAHFLPDRYYIDAGAMFDSFLQASAPSQGMYSFIDMESGFKIDLFPLRALDPAQAIAFQHRIKEDVLAGYTGMVYAPADLLIQKLRWHAASESERQFQDCLNLLLTDLERPVPQIDWEYVDQWVQQLGSPVAHAWELVKAAALNTTETDTAP